MDEGSRSQAPEDAPPREGDLDLRRYFDRVVVINLDRRPDRWARLQRHLEEIAWPFGPPLRVSAIDGAQCSRPPWWRSSPGAWGCLRSLQTVIEAARRDEVQRLLVLEDDVVFTPDLDARARRFLEAVPEDWEQLYFGGQHMLSRGPAWARVNAEVVRPRNVNRCHAHALRRPYLEVLAEHLDDLRSHARWPTFNVDHRMGQLHADPERRIYAPTRWFAGQHEGHSDVQGQRCPTRFWHADPSRGP